MKTTLNFDDRLLRTAKARAAEEGVTLTRLIELALRDYLQAGTGKSEQPFRAHLLTKRGRPVAGVNLDDRDALHERMDVTSRRSRRRAPRDGATIKSSPARLYRLGLALDDAEVTQGRGFRRAPALLPIAHRGGGEAVPCGEPRLRETGSGPHPSHHMGGSGARRHGLGRRKVVGVRFCRGLEGRVRKAVQERAIRLRKRGWIVGIRRMSDCLTHDTSTSASSMPE